MIIHRTDIDGCCLIETPPHRDERGEFARLFCRDLFASHGLNPHIEQCSRSLNPRRGTLRGMHYQIAPYAETKIVQCVRGSIYDVVLDLRGESRTFGRWISRELTQERPTLMYVPAGCAHGFQTLLPDTDVMYYISAPYSADHSRGVRWNDPKFQIHWPLNELIISDRDRRFSDFVNPIHPAAHGSPDPCATAALD